MIAARALRVRPLLALAFAALLAGGCAASAPSRTAGPATAPATATTSAAADSVQHPVIADLQLRRQAELAGGHDRYRVVNADLSVEFRSPAGGSLDVGELVLGGHPLTRTTSGSGARARTRYRAPRELLEGVPAPGSEGWVELVATGSAAFAPARLRVQLAPFAEVREPAMGEAFYRSQGLAVVLVPPPAGTLVRVRYTSADDALTAYDAGAGRWEFPRDQVATLAAGPARVVIETDVGCSDCPVRAGLVVRSSTHSELEIQIAIFDN